MGYLPFQVPSNLIIARVPRPGLCTSPVIKICVWLKDTDICVAVVTWGIISTCTAAVQSFAALAVVRVILGAVEAVFFPGKCFHRLKWRLIIIRRNLLFERLVHPLLISRPYD